MLKASFTLFIIFGIAASAKCDTIDFWHVYYNKDKRIACNKPDYCTFSFPKDSVKAADSITLYYFAAARCYDCVETLSVKDKEGKEVYSVTIEEEDGAKGLAIPVNVLIDSRSHNFDLYYRRSETDKERRILMVSID